MIAATIATRRGEIELSTETGRWSGAKEMAELANAVATLDKARPQNGDPVLWAIGEVNQFLRGRVDMPEVRKQGKGIDGAKTPPASRMSWDSNKHPRDEKGRFSVGSRAPRKQLERLGTSYTEIQERFAARQDDRRQKIEDDYGRMKSDMESEFVNFRDDAEAKAAERLTNVETSLAKRIAQIEASYGQDPSDADFDRMQSDIASAEVAARNLKQRIEADTTDAIEAAEEALDKRLEKLETKFERLRDKMEEREEADQDKLDEKIADLTNAVIDARADELEEVENLYLDLSDKAETDEEADALFAEQQAYEKQIEDYYEKLEAKLKDYGGKLARMSADRRKDGLRWITVKPNGPDAEGRPVLIDSEGTIKAGMGGKFDGKKIDNLKGKEEAEPRKRQKSLLEGDTAISNVPLDKRGGGSLDSQIDRWKKQDAAEKRAKSKEQSQESKTDKQEAKALFAEYGERIIAQTAANKGLIPKEIRDTLDAMVKWEPAKAIKIIRGFEKEWEAKQAAEAPKPKNEDAKAGEDRKDSEYFDMGKEAFMKATRGSYANRGQYNIVDRKTGQVIRTRSAGSVTEAKEKAWEALQAVHGRKETVDSRVEKEDRYAEMAKLKREALDESQAEAEARLARLKEGKPQGVFESNDFARNPERAIADAENAVNRYKSESRELSDDDKKMLDMAAPHYKKIDAAKKAESKPTESKKLERESLEKMSVKELTKVFDSQGRQSYVDNMMPKSKRELVDKILSFEEKMSKK